MINGDTTIVVMDRMRLQLLNIILIGLKLFLHKQITIVMSTDDRHAVTTIKYYLNRIRVFLHKDIHKITSIANDHTAVTLIDAFTRPTL